MKYGKKTDQFRGSEESSFEQDVVNLYIDGMNYQQIAQQLGKTSKSIDNALQRIKKKLGEKIG